MATHKITDEDVIEISELFLKLLLTSTYVEHKTMSGKITFIKGLSLTPNKLIELAEWWKLRLPRISSTDEKMAGIAQKSKNERK